MGPSPDDFHLLCENLVEWIDAPPPHPPSWSEKTWGRFQEACLVHGVAPLLYAGSTENHSWPSEIATWIEYQYAQNRRRVTRMVEELSVILAAFARSGIPVMPLKGLVLTELVYEDIGLRPMNDLDLLLAPSDFEAGERLLAELGYEKIFTGWKHTKFSKPENRQIVDLNCEHPDNPRPLEVHPRCVEQVRETQIDLTEQVWETAEVGRFLGQQAWLMNTDVLWVYLLIHATHHMLHNNFRLIQLVDLVRLRPKLRAPMQLLNSIDARGTIAPLALLQHYFPSRQTKDLLLAQRERVSASFADWVDSLDLFTVSYLNPTPWRV